jgi:hypothetical protein
MPLLLVKATPPMSSTTRVTTSTGLLSAAVSWLKVFQQKVDASERTLLGVAEADGLVEPLAAGGVGGRVRGVERDCARRRDQGQEGSDCGEVELHLCCTCFERFWDGSTA